MTKFKPTPYDLTQPAELIRLLRECRGYLHTCRRDHHGTDFQGREFAMEAIDKICNGEVRVTIQPPDSSLTSTDNMGWPE
ncbi:MAG: hypothetical protein JWP25_3604 [Bradyrhizobium sp.]|nr:hypothetical protein [Bradyrhizobium sp.]